MKFACNTRRDYHRLIAAGVIAGQADVGDRVLLIGRNRTATD